MKEIIKWVRIISGIILIVIGVIAFFIPIVPGFLFIFLGLVLLGIKKKRIKGWAEKIKKWFLGRKDKNDKNRNL